MSALIDRLRDAVRPHRVSEAGEAAARIADRPEAPHAGAATARREAAAADVLGGEWRDSDRSRFLVVDRSYAPGHRHGWMSVADGLPPQGGWPRLPLLGGSAGGRLLFVDLETTGLAGGAGTYAFLVGCGWFEGGRFHIRQLFLSRFDAERALLDALVEMAGAASTVVTYNGKTFDMPLLETRFTLHRLPMPFAGMPHVDLLHPARRLWRAQDAAPDERETAPGRVPIADPHAAACRLSGLEHRLLGHEREGDVPGFEIPSRYFHFVRTGDAGPLEAVLEHNRHDLLSLALLTSRAAHLLDRGATGATTAREAFGLGRLYERAAMTDSALSCFARAADMGGALDADALRAYAVLSRRARRFDEAADAWQRLLALRACPQSFLREAADALAVHHEHRLRSLDTAQTFARQSLQVGTGAVRRQAAEHRLARLARKIAEVGSASLF